MRAIDEKLILQTHVQSAEALGRRLILGADPDPLLVQVRPRLGVRRFARSNPKSVSFELSPAVGLKVTVGKDISSATNGSSVRMVAGKKRWPANPWASAWPQAKKLAQPIESASVMLLDVLVIAKPPREVACDGCTEGAAYAVSEGVLRATALDESAERNYVRKNAEEERGREEEERRGPRAATARALRVERCNPRGAQHQAQAAARERSVPNT